MEKEVSENAEIYYWAEDEGAINAMMTLSIFLNQLKQLKPEIYRNHFSNPDAIDLLSQLNQAFSSLID